MTATVADQTPLAIDSAPHKEFVGPTDILGGDNSRSSNNKRLPQIERSGLAGGGKGEFGGAEKLAGGWDRAHLAFGCE